MSNKRKIINDPVFGFINIPSDFLYDIIQHRYFQRLQRIRQLGLAALVYPGAQHTRLQHSLGAFYLTSEAVKQLRSKGHNITDQEAEGVMAAILLHDVGHGPFSHVLEHTLVHDITHEELSQLLMQRMNAEFAGRLDTAISIFNNHYPKYFLHQLISSQLDMDRLDYLRRDCFYTGVVEGEIGSARIIKMLDVCDDHLVIERKGIYSIENFLIARRFMYWQVYLHKTSLAAEVMLVKLLQRARWLAQHGTQLFGTPALLYFLQHDANRSDFLNKAATLDYFTDLDDNDLLSAIKVWSHTDDRILALLSRNFIERRLFKAIEVTPLNQERIEQLNTHYADILGINPADAHYLYGERNVAQNTYTSDDEGIRILFADGTTRDIAQVSDILNQETHKHYLCYMAPLCQKLTQI